VIHPDVSRKSDDGCLTRGNPEKFLGPALVAYIDILGMSHALLNDWGAHSTSALHRFLRIKNAIPRDDAQSQITVAFYDAELDRDVERYLSVTRTLSDSVVSMMALPNECDLQTFFFRIYGLLFVVRLIWQHALDEGFTVRGAIEFGDMFWNEAEFTGPGLVYAYGLEKKYADSSRILVGPRLLEKIVEATKKGIPLVHSANPVNAFTFGTDGKIVVDPHFLIGEHLLPSLKTLRDSAGDAKPKYDEVIRLLETPKERLPRPSMVDLEGSWI
jgi:hypothetical protein